MHSPTEDQHVASVQECAVRIWNPKGHWVKPMFVCLNESNATGKATGWHRPEWGILEVWVVVLKLNVQILEVSDSYKAREWDLQGNSKPKWHMYGYLLQNQCRCEAPVFCVNVHIPLGLKSRTQLHLQGIQAQQETFRCMVIRCCFAASSSVEGSYALTSRPKLLGLCGCNLCIVIGNPCACVITNDFFLWDSNRAK